MGSRAALAAVVQLGSALGIHIRDVTLSCKAVFSGLGYDTGNFLR